MIAHLNRMPPEIYFDDAGSGINIEVISMNPDQAEIRINYTVPPTKMIFMFLHTTTVGKLKIYGSMLPIIQEILKPIRWQLKMQMKSRYRLC
jgi:hypothetical protein